MTMTYQQQFVLDGMAGRAAILNLNARHNRLYSAGDLAGWITTFRHSGATYTRAGESSSRTTYHRTTPEITVDGVDATQVCVVLLFRDNGFRASGTFTDRLIYERGDWYFTSRELEWDLVPRENALPV